MTEQRKYTPQETIQIYTDWANHYLEKARCKRRVSRLSTDCSDGVLLADVIESVINMKIPDINRKPKTSDQMLDNINSCLSILRSQRVAGVDSVATQDLRDGRLKAVLALFFALSRHKQALKQRASAQQPNCNTATGGSHASLAGTHTASSNAGTIDHRTMAPQLTDTHAVPPIRQIATSGGVVGLKGGTSIPLPGSKTRPPAAAPSVGGGSSRASSPGGSLIPTRGSGVPAPQTKSSLKLYPPATTNVPSGKRTSSSSGVSSARSDSSASLDNRKCANKSLTRPNNVPQQKPQIVQASKTGQVINKKEIETEKKITNAKLPEPKIKSSNSSNKILSTNDKMIPPKQSGLLQSTGIPKPTAAVKGTSKNVKDDTKSVPILKNNITRENSSVSLTCVKPAVPVVALVSPIMSESVQQNQENENHEEEVCVPMKAMYDLHHTNGGYASDGDILQQRKGFNAVQDGYMSDAYQNCRTGTRVPDVLSDPSRPRRGGPAEDASAPPPPLGPRPANGVAQHNGGAQVVAVRQQRHRLVDPTSQSAQWKKYTDSPGVGSPITTSGTANTSSPSPTPTANNHRERKDSPHRQSKDKNSSSSKVKVPQSFGYVKRNSVGLNGTSMAIVSGSNAVGQATNSKTAQVSAVPRTKVKVSGGTQTCSSDLQPSHKSNTQYKSYSLTGNTASQLSQSVRERLLMGSQSLPKAVIGSGHDYPRQPRAKASDGSLSDTQATDSMSQYAPWLRHSNTYSVAPRLTETDSLESLSSLPGHRSSLTHSRMIRDPAARISRSNSIRSTKSEKLYPSMLHRGIEIEHEPYYCLPVGAQQHWSQPTSPAPRLYPMSPTHSAPRHANDDIHGSTVSLVSTTSSLYSSAEEKQAHEIRKLRRELIDAQEKVHTLTSQLTTNAHVVSAFEQSLSSMTQRLQHLTATSERKESELQELRTAMDNLRAQSVQAGLTSGLARQPSSDSVSSMSSACSLDKQDKKKKKGWLRSSFTKAFSRNAKQTKVQSLSEGETSEQSSHHHHTDPKPSQIIMAEQNPEVEELQKQLREKDLVLTDIRLEALSSAHQLESLKDTVMKMRNEMLSLKQNNERLQRMVGGSIPIDDNEMDCINEPPPDVIAVDDGSVEQETDGKRITISVYLGQPHTFERYYDEHYTCDGSQSGPEGNEISIAYKNIGASMSWGQLDGIVRRAFKQHMARVDPGSCLGLGGDSIARYRLGEAERSPDAQPPDLLPVGYVIGGVNVLHVILQPVCALAFDALIPRSVAQRLVSLLSEHKRLVLCGPPGTGKTFLAQKLATFHALTQGRDPAEAVATFNVDHKSGKELRQYLAHLGERATAECDGDDSRQSDCDVLPSVVVLDDLHRAGPLNEALGSLPRSLPCLVGTMAQAACSATSLQLQHGFRWVLVAPHIEPASGLLGRVLRRRLACLELSQGDRPELAAVLGWLPRVWKHLNKFLETHSSSDVAIGPRFFLACPLDINAAKAWFSDVWNYSLAPYLREAAREGLQLYGKRAAWVDPCQFILDTYPWPGNLPQNLTRIEPQDVGLENNSNAQSESESDPLLNMLMRLQEAANYSSTHSNDSDCASLDSNFTHESSVGSESVL